MPTILETDVVVVGGGMAGAYAAIEASRRGSKVLLLTKGFLAKSGCSPMAAFLSVPPYYTPPDSELSIFEDGVTGGASGIAGGSYIFLANQEALKDTFDRAPEILADLEAMGVYFRRDEEGNFVLLGSGFDKDGKIRKPRFSLAWNFGLTGKSIMDVLKGEIIKRGISYKDEVRVTKVLTNGGAAVGVAAIDYATGEFFVVRAKSVILATGSGVYLWRYTTASRECTGDGHMMALRAGAELTDIEFVTWHFADVAWPEAWRRLQMYPQPYPGSGFYPHWYDSKGNRFIQDVEIGSKEAQAMAVAKSVVDGTVQKRGGYYASWRHVNENELKEWFQNYYHLKKLGMDISLDMIECGMSSHSWHGGIRTNGKTETCVPGLYGAGGVAPNHYPRLHTALWGGKVAAIYASERAAGVTLQDLDMEQVQDEEARVTGLLRTEPANGKSPTQVKRRIWDLFFDRMWYIKDAETMKKGLEELRSIRENDVPRMRASAKSRNSNQEWVDALDVIDMLDLGELLIMSSLRREESRGPFVRRDFPSTDDERWMKNLVIKLKDGNPEFRIEPVALTLMRPKGAA